MAMLGQGARQDWTRGDIRAQLTVSVPASAEAGSVFRRAIRSLDTWLRSRAAEDAELLVSELATNGVKHACSPDGNPPRITLHAQVGPDALRIEVRDRGHGFDAARAARRGEIGGWGLQLVDGLADRWGVDRDPSTTVWFEIAGAAA